MKKQTKSKKKISSEFPIYRKFNDMGGSRTGSCAYFKLYETGKLVTIEEYFYLDHTYQYDIGRKLLQSKDYYFYIEKDSGLSPCSKREWENATKRLNRWMKRWEIQ